MYLPAMVSPIPIALLGVVLLIQLLSRASCGAACAKRGSPLARGAQKGEAPGLKVKKYILTNPNCFGKRLAEVRPAPHVGPTSAHLARR